MAVCLAALAVAAVLYSPATHGSFTFDDLGLPFEFTLADAPVWSWISRVRPVLMLSYGLNHSLSPGNPYWFHLFNILIHAMNTGLIFTILGRLLALAGWPAARARLGACAGSAVFLVHPLATESVSYIAGRSESLAAFFVLASYALFLSRRERGLQWRDAAGVLALFALALATKENSIALAGVLLLTAWFFPRGSEKKLYLAMIPAALLVLPVGLYALTHGGNAGFNLREFTWYQYAFTQARAIFTYVRLALLPFGQSVDHDFPISFTLLQHGAWLYGLALAGLIAAAVVFRKRAPLACFGFLMFLIWLAPTSSVIPIADPLVERRMYLPILGLILMACDAASRVRLEPRVAWSAFAAMLVVFSVLTWQRNVLWGNPADLLAAAAMQSQRNPRPVANLTETLIAENRCQEALPWLQRAHRLLPHSYVIEASWGRALECVGRREEALTHLQTAANLHPGWKLFELIGLLNAEMNRMEPAGEALRKAVAMEPNAGSPHRSLALWHEAQHDFDAAQQEYRQALQIDVHDSLARAGLARAQAALVASAP